MTTLKTTDLNQAAYLMALGHSLVGVSGSPGGRRVFQFDATARADADTFYRNGTVPARAFAHALGDLKTLIRQS